MTCVSMFMFFRFFGISGDFLVFNWDYLETCVYSRLDINNHYKSNSI
jgi:hypothetical protein